MRVVGLFGRFCLKRGLPRLSRQHISRPPWPRQQLKGSPRRVPIIGGVLMAALAPAAFLKLAEENEDQEKTAEMQMLEASREEVRKTVSPDAHGLSRLCQTIWVYLYCYVYDPIATGFRFIHLAIIFVPVVVTVPAIWLGHKQGHDGARSGTLWWYRFLVKAMERAGPAFIKVRSYS
jgi:aarF domain-containing kinase